jgi:type VII secretion protein EccE
LECAVTAPTASRPQSRFIPARPSWRRLTVLVSLLLLGWAALLPAGRAPQWWHYIVAAALILAFAGSWHGQHLSTAVARWTPMTWHNRRQRSRRTNRPQGRRRRDKQARASKRPAATRAGTLEAQIVIHLRPHPHALTTPGDHSDQLPWEVVTAWLNRYGVRADALTVCSLTRTPPASGLRSDSAALLGGRNTQHHDTWLTYTLRAENNVGALTARQTTMGTPAGTTSEDDAPVPHRAALADTTARRLIAELRERGWLATLSDVAEQLPQFVPPTVTVRRETWTGTQYSDGFRAVYAVEPGALPDVLEALPTLNTKATWVTVSVRSRGRQPATIEAAVGTLTAARPPRHPLPSLDGFHGLHRRIAPALSAAGLDEEAGVDLPPSQVTSSDLAALRWPTSAVGVPIGFNRARQPVYLGLASPEPVRITVTGTPAFHLGIIARLALSGLPVALYTADPRQWVALANHAAPQQFLMRPSTPPPEAIVVSDGSSEPPAGAITVTLRRPQSAQAPSTTIVITQDGQHPDLFYITTAHGRQWLSTRLSQDRSRVSERG